ncbi:coiled-coil domain-containing protein AGAP005037 [Schistocerca cancellata]|uniref:coiled-coil domain-containing protein AGAP005037 n=1 Tax=Schistocerca cancellata TaxID=274614 RepID=UPI002118DFF7|nr:coiled-coil domain-containing protein AGAP005037 [Schistocerca cancellata]
MTHSYPPGPSTAPGGAATLPRGGALLRTYSPAVVGPKSAGGGPGGVPPPKPVRTYQHNPLGSPLSPAGKPGVGGGPPVPPDRLYGPFLPLPSPRDAVYSPTADRLHTESGYMSSPERGGPSRAYAPPYAPAGASAYEDPYYSQYAPRSGSITPVIDEEARIRVEHMERQLANLTGLVQKALTQTPTAVGSTSAGGPTPAPRDYAVGTGVQSGTGAGSNAVSTGTSAASTASQAGGRDTSSGGYRNAADEYDKHSSSSSASIPDDSYLRSDTKPPKLGKDKSVSFEKSVSFSDEPPDMNSPKQHSPQHSADSKPTKPAIKSSTLPRMSSQERDRHKPAPPPKPVSLSPGQYDGRHVYRADLQLTPEMYNQLRGLQKKAKDLRQEVRNLRRMSQAQAHSVRETIRDTFIKIRAMLLSGGEEVWAAGGDAEKLRLSREEDLYKQEMLRLEKDLTELESTVEELRGNVINRKTRVNMSDVENMALILSKSSKTVADLKVRFPSLQEGMKSLLSSEMEKVVREEKFLKEEPERLESALRRCKKLTGTLVTLKRLASVQEQRLPPSTTPDSRLSPTPGGGGADSDTPITPPAHGKACTVPARGVMAATVGGGRTIGDDASRARPENALDALLDELQTFARPPPPTGVGSSSLGETGRKGSVDSSTSLTSTPGGVGLRRLHSYPSSSDSAGDGSGQSGLVSRLQVSAGGTGGMLTDSSQQQQRPPPVSPKPPVPERNAELLSQLAGRRVPPPPPPRTSSRSPLASPTSPSLPPRAQHGSAGSAGTLRRGAPGRGSLREPARGGSGTALSLAPDSGMDLSSSTEGRQRFDPASNSSSCESVNSQEGLISQQSTPQQPQTAQQVAAAAVAARGRKELLEQRHQELLRKQRALQEQYARLQQLQRGGAATLAVVPPAGGATPDLLLLKKTGSESNLLAKMGLGAGLATMSGSLTHLASAPPSAATPVPQPRTSVQQQQQQQQQQQEKPPASTSDTVPSTAAPATTTTPAMTGKIYETDIL